MKKKMIALLLAITTYMSLATSAYAVSGNATLTPAFSVLIEHGFSEDFLARRTDAEITELYQLCQAEDIVFGGSEIAYYSEAGEIQPYGTIPTTDMTLETFILYVLNSNGSIKSGIFYIDYSWMDGHPHIKKEDAIAVNWDTGMWTYDGNFQHTDYSKLYGDELSSQTITRPAESVQGGLGYYATLQLGEGDGGTSGSTRFYLAPANSPVYPYNSQSSYFTSQINVNYVHDKNPLPVKGVSFSTSGIGVDIDFSSLADEASTTNTGRFAYSK